MDGVRAAAANRADSPAVVARVHRFVGIAGELVTVVAAEDGASAIQSESTTAEQAQAGLRMGRGGAVSPHCPFPPSRNARWRRSRLAEFEQLQAPRD